jgi:hypothetical protein
VPLLSLTSIIRGLGKRAKITPAAVISFKIWYRKIRMPLITRTAFIKYNPRVT